MSTSEYLKYRCLFRDHLSVPTPPGFTDLTITPDTVHPFGRRGHTMASAWYKYGEGKTGILFCDGDVAVDPDDIEAMDKSISCNPKSVNVAPARLWPSQPYRGINGFPWVWAHAHETTWPWCFSQEVRPEEPIHQFTFCFTYLPGSLINHCIADGMSRWEYPGVDGRVMKTARAVGTPVHLVEDCWPKHLNY